MKKILFVAVIFITANLYAQHSLKKIWQTDSMLKTPESVLYDANGKILYVSNIGGNPSGKEGKGSIGKVGLDGKIINRDWVTGLNAPKGLGLYKNYLYAADVTEVVVINITKASIIQRIPVAGAVFLNDITVDSKGTVYVSDTRTNKVHRIENGHASDYLENMKGANGVLAVGTDLYVLTSGSLQKADANKKLTTIAEGMDESTDGIEMVKENEFLVTGWSGIMYYVKADGSKQVLFDTRAQKINSADIGYNSKNRTVYVPTFFKNSIIAYRLK
jgi:sugar lactone lactonase YvrE